MKHLIGVYDYTVVLTYFSLFSAVFGMIHAIKGNFAAGVLALMLCGFFDAFDGMVARTKKDRTEDEKNFGIQLDSLCDVIAFGIFPAMLCYQMGVDGTLGMILICFYCMCAVIRLAFFNVLEANRQKTQGGINKYYRGLPVTASAIIVPIVYAVNTALPESAANAMWHLMLGVVGFLFIYDFKVKKPDYAKMLVRLVSHS